MLNENKHVKKFTKIIKAAKMVQKRPRKSDHLLGDEVQVYKETIYFSYKHRYTVLVPGRLQTQV